MKRTLHHTIDAEINDEAHEEEEEGTVFNTVRGVTIISVMDFCFVFAIRATINRQRKIITPSFA